MLPRVILSHVKGLDAKYSGIAVNTQIGMLYFYFGLDARPLNTIGMQAKPRCEDPLFT